MQGWPRIYITLEDALMVIYAVEKRIKRKTMDWEIFDGPYMRLVIAEDLNFEGKVFTSILTLV